MLCSTKLRMVISVKRSESSMTYFHVCNKLWPGSSAAFCNLHACWSNTIHIIFLPNIHAKFDPRFKHRILHAFDSVWLVRGHACSGFRESNLPGDSTPWKQNALGTRLIRLKPPAASNTTIKAVI